MDKNGNPMMKVKQNDFSTAIRSLIATTGLVEGSFGQFVSMVVTVIMISTVFLLL